MPLLDEQELDPTSDPSFTPGGLSIQDIIDRERERRAVKTPVVGVTPVRTKLPANDPNDTDWDREFERQKRKMAGTEQKYDEAGNPRNRTFGEKIKSGISGTLFKLGVMGDADSVNKRATDRTSNSLGMKQRLEQMKLDARRAISDDTNAVKLTGLELKASIDEQKTAIMRMRAAGLITLDQEKAALAKITAQQKAGIMDASSSEGKAKIGLVNSQADKNRATAEDLRATPNQNAEQALIEAVKSGDPVRIKNAQAAAEALARMKAIGRTPPVLGTQSSKTGTLDGLNETTQSQKIFGQRPTVPDIASIITGAGANGPAPTDIATSPILPPGQRATTLSPDLPGSSELQKQLDARAQLANSAPSQNPATFQDVVTSAVSRSGRGAPITGKPRPEIADNSQIPQSLVKSLKSARESHIANDTYINAQIAAYTSGQLDKMSGVAGTSIGNAWRNLDPEGINSMEGYLRRLGTSYLAQSEIGDFGTRVMKVLIDAEKANLAQPWNSAATKLSMATGGYYARELAMLSKAGNGAQKALAEEVASSPARQEALMKSMIAFTDAVNMAKAQGKTPPTPPADLRFITRTDEEIAKEYARELKGMNEATKKRAIFDLRATGGNTQMSMPAKSKNQNKSAGY